MAATYTVRIAALAIGVGPKWIDNLLSHHSLPGVSGGRQGLERTISLEGLVAIELVRVTTVDLGVSLSRAVGFAVEVLRHDPARGALRTAAGIELNFPLAEIERRIRERLVEAVEAAPRPPRGRPRLA